MKADYPHIGTLAIRASENDSNSPFYKGDDDAEILKEYVSESVEEYRKLKEEQQCK